MPSVLNVPTITSPHADSEYVTPNVDSISLATLGAHMLFGEIDDVTSKAACEFILKCNLMLAPERPLTMFVNTEGGGVANAFALIDVMTTSRIAISTVGIGQVASMGLLISSAGTKGYRVMTKNTEIMAHQFYAVLYGKQHELKATNRYYGKLEQKFINHFLRHSSMNEKMVRDVLFGPSDRYLTTQEAKRYGLCDVIVDYAAVDPSMLDKKARRKVKKTSASG